MAKHAISFFDKSFAATSRLTVEAAFAKASNTITNGNTNDYRPWSQHSKGSSRYDSLHKEEIDAEEKTKKKKNKETEEKDVVDEKLERKKQEFIDVMMGGKKSSSNLFWANDDGEGKSSDAKVVPLEKKSEDVQPDSDSESSASDSDDDSVDVMKTYKSEVSDMDFLKSKVLSEKENLSDDEENDDEGEGGIGSDSSSAPSSGESDSDDSDSDDDSDAGDIINANENLSEDKKNDDAVGSEKKRNIVRTREDETEQPGLVTTARLFIRNLPFSATEEDIRRVFSPYGNIVECHIPIDDTNRNKGYAFVKFASEDEAASALEKLDGTAFQGRLVHILPAREEKDTSVNDEIDPKDMTHKMKKELERQKDAGNSTGWNASFIRGDAVVDNLASRLGLDKGAILNVKDGSSGDAAVRLALGETQVIEENRKYFEKHGVDIGGLVSLKSEKGGAAKRSSNVILVKNLPFDTSQDELSKVFNAVGGNKPQVLLPPSRTIALVIYENNNDAKRAFRKLAYKRFKHVPLYLEWASLTTTPKKEESDQVESGLDSKPPTDVGEKEDAKDEDEPMEEGASTSIYVKNLNFRTTEDALLRVFEEEVGSVRSVRIPTKVASIKSASGTKSIDKPVTQSMGFGFVEFKSDAAARKALTSLQGKVVDGHELELKMSKANSSSSAKVATGGEKKASTKIIVRNVPFQASRTEILQLFGSFGQLKTVRLPKKFDGGHRGFAFVEFTGAKEALNAMKTLSQTHLYGRHLVIEWADDKSDIDTLRDKAKRDTSGAGISNAPKNKKIRFDENEEFSF